MFALKSDASDFKHGAKVLLFSDIANLFTAIYITRCTTQQYSYITRITDHITDGKRHKKSLTISCEASCRFEVVYASKICVVILPISMYLLNLFGVSRVSSPCLIRQHGYLPATFVKKIDRAIDVSDVTS